LENIFLLRTLLTIYSNSSRLLHPLAWRCFLAP